MTHLQISWELFVFNVKISFPYFTTKDNFLYVRNYLICYYFENNEKRCAYVVVYSSVISKKPSGWPQDTQGCNSIPHSRCRCVSLNWHQLPVKLPALSSPSFLQTASRKWANTLSGAPLTAQKRRSSKRATHLLCLWGVIYALKWCNEVNFYCLCFRIQ